MAAPPAPLVTISPMPSSNSKRPGSEDPGSFEKRRRASNVTPPPQLNLHSMHQRAPSIGGSCGSAPSMTPTFGFLGYDPQLGPFGSATGWPPSPDNQTFPQHSMHQSPLFSPMGRGPPMVSPAAAGFRAIVNDPAATNNVPGAAVLELSDEDLAFFDTAMFDISPNGSGGPGSIHTAPSDHFTTPPAAPTFDHPPCIPLDLFNNLNCQHATAQAEYKNMRERLASIIGIAGPDSVDIVEAAANLVSELKVLGKTKYDEGIRFALSRQESFKDQRATAAESKISEQEAVIIELKGELVERDGRIKELEKQAQDYHFIADYNREYADNYGQRLVNLTYELQNTHRSISDAVSLHGISLSDVQAPPSTVSHYSPSPSQSLAPLPQSISQVKAESLHHPPPGLFLPTPDNTPSQHAMSVSLPAVSTTAASAAVSPSPARTLDPGVEVNGLGLSMTPVREPPPAMQDMASVKAAQQARIIAANMAKNPLAYTPSRSTTLGPAFVPTPAKRAVSSAVPYNLSPHSTPRAGKRSLSHGGGVMSMSSPMSRTASLASPMPIREVTPHSSPWQGHMPLDRTQL